MNPNNWKRIKQIFDVAVDLPTGERTAFLAENCAADLRGEIEKMLRAEDSEQSLLDAPVLDLKSLWGEAETVVGKKVGEYKILREIGRGGMGAVYEASRDDGEFEQRVALKLIKRGMDSDEILRRFRHERQILATLEHSNIARLLGGGVSGEGSPFYAMEFVEGVPVNEFCEQNNLAVNERLELFRQICAAVSYAHSRLVVHRDLKPSNILVTADGTVKLLDFGISKILSNDTNTEKGTATMLGMMTPAYASPEQKRGETVTTATDVYSLGVILSELVQSPKSKVQSPKSKVQSRKATSANERTTNGSGLWTLDFGLWTNSDLQAILQTALREEPERRYSSVEQFAEDVRKHLTGLPILARPDTLSYRTAKFVRRNQIAVFSAALIVLALLGGISVALWQARQAEFERKLAQKRFEVSRKVANALVFKYSDAVANLPDSAAVREMILADASQYLDEIAEDAGGDASLQRELAQAYQKLGSIQGSPNTISTGNTAAAALNFEKAAGFFETLHTTAESADDLLKIYADLTNLYWRTNELERRRFYSDKRKSLVEDLHRRFPENLKYKMEFLRLQHGAGGSLLKNDFAAGEHFYQENILPQLAAAENAGEERRFVESTGIRIYNALGLAYKDYGLLQIESGANRADAERYFQKSLEFYTRAAEIYEWQFAADQHSQSLKRNRAVGLTTVGIALRELERFDEAFDFLNRGHAEWVELAAFDQNNLQAVFDLGDSNSAIGLFYHKRKNYAEAIAAFEKSLEYFDRVIAADAKHHEAISYKIDVLCFLADSHAAAGRFAKSLELFAQAKTFSQNLTAEPNDKIQIAGIYLQTGRAFLKSGDADKARIEFNEALKIIEKSGAADAELQKRVVDFELSKTN